jgi:serine/threonine-protein kinase
VRVFDFGQEEDGTVYLAMELLTGRTLRGEIRLREREKRGPLSEAEAIEVAIAVAGSLGEAHAMGLVHRDIGPNNIYFHSVAASEPVVKVLDFGLVKDAGRSLTRVNQLFGTIGFMSPEQARGRGVGPQSDLYSLGITMWWMLAGKPPFDGTPDEVLRCHLFKPLPPISEHAPVSKELEEIIARAAAKDVVDRFPDAPSLKLALEACRDGASQRRQQRTEVMPARSERTPRAMLVAAVAISSIAIGIWSTRSETSAATIPPAPVVRSDPPPAKVVEEIEIPVVVPDPEPKREVIARPSRAKKKIKPKPIEAVAPPAPPPSLILKTRI